jgi:uncharacterized damage-inducible protein DinB
MVGAPELAAFYDGWAEQQDNLLSSIRPLSLEQMQLRPAPGEYAIWQLASNMAGGRLYWLCGMLGEDDRGLWKLFEGGGWEDDPSHPRSAAELEQVFLKTWDIVLSCIDRWKTEDLYVPVTRTDAFGKERTISPAWVLWRLMAHEVHHGSEISTILRIHGLPTAMNR